MLITKLARALGDNETPDNIIPTAAIQSRFFKGTHLFRNLLT